MELACVAYGNSYVYWVDTILLPMKERARDGSLRYFRKAVAFEDAKRYWEYTCENNIYNVYYVKRTPTISKRLAASFSVLKSPREIQLWIQGGVISVHDCEVIEKNKPHLRERRIMATSNWSVQYNHKSILDLLKDRTKTSYSDALKIIRNEGGYVDAQGIIHQGSAEDKIVEL